MRSMGHPDYVHRPMSDERRSRLSEIHRKRWGAPDGFCTVYGVHVPFEHRTPVRYWADWVAYRQGWDGAQGFVEGLKSENWASVPRLWTLYQRKLEVRRTADFLRYLEAEARRAD